MIPIQIPLFKVFMSPEAIAAATNVLKSGYIGEGPIVKEFENSLKHAFNHSVVNYDIMTCNSATSAEHMLYHMLKAPRKMTMYYEFGSSSLNWPGLDEHSEVISTPLTCTATNWPIIHNGLKLVWADIDPNTMNISLESVKEKINKNTRLITVVHWGGYPVDLDRLQQIVQEAEQLYGTKILIIEDCAHAFGSTYKGYHVGFTGNFSTFSTQAIKHVTSVDGGFLCSPYLEFSKSARLIRWYGIDRDTPRTDFRCEQDIPEIGFKFHMNDVNAAIGMANLKHAHTIVNKHRTNASFYNSALKNIPGITLLENSADRSSAYWLYTLKVERRMDFMRMMSNSGIVTSRVHERNDKHSCLSHLKTYLPNLDNVSETMLCIPVGWWVTEEDTNYIVDTIKKGW